MSSVVFISAPAVMSEAERASKFGCAECAQPAVLKVSHATTP